MQGTVIRAFKAIEEDTQTLIASRGRTTEGLKQVFFCDSGADFWLVNESKAKRDHMRINTEDGKTLKVIDVTGDKVKLVGTTYYWVGLTKDRPRKPLKCYVTKDGEFDEIILSTQLMKKWGILPDEFPRFTQRNSWNPQRTTST